MEFNSKLTKELCEIYGPTGREFKVAEYIQEQIRGHVDEMWVDCLGNLIAHKKGPGKRVVLSAHMDQLGLMIKTIDEKGFGRIGALGSIKPYNLIDSRIQTESGIQGVMICEKKRTWGRLHTMTSILILQLYLQKKYGRKYILGRLLLHDRNITKMKNV